MVGVPSKIRKICADRKMPTREKLKNGDRRGTASRPDYALSNIRMTTSSRKVSLPHPLLNRSLFSTADLRCNNNIPQIPANNPALSLSIPAPQVRLLHTQTLPRGHRPLHRRPPLRMAGSPSLPL